MLKWNLGQLMQCNVNERHCLASMLVDVSFSSITCLRIFNASTHASSNVMLCTNTRTTSYSASFKSKIVGGRSPFSFASFPSHTSPSPFWPHPYSWSRGPGCHPQENFWNSTLLQVTFSAFWDRITRNNRLSHLVKISKSGWAICPCGWVFTDLVYCKKLLQHLRKHTCVWLCLFWPDLVWTWPDLDL